MTDQELFNFAQDAKRLKAAINVLLNARGKRQRIDAWDAVTLLHAIGRYFAVHQLLDGQVTSPRQVPPPPSPATRHLPDAGPGTP